MALCPPSHELQCEDAVIPSRGHSLHVSPIQPHLAISTILTKLTRLLLALCRTLCKISLGFDLKLGVAQSLLIHTA